MKKFISYLCIFLILNNSIIFGTFAFGQIENQLFQIKVNDGNNYSGDIEVKPGTKLSILVSGQNQGDTISNPYFDFDFSNTNFSYDPSRLKTYLDGSVINQNIQLLSFNPGVNNQLALTSTAALNSYLDAYYIDLYINQNTPDNVLTISSTLKSDSNSSSSITRNIFINSNPHIIDYYFEKDGIVTSQLTRGGGENVDFIIKVKDYNGCDNIDNATVFANLSSLGLSGSEPLVFQSCNSDVAIFKKSLITTIVLPGTKTFSYTDFIVTDESGNLNKPNDPQTTFDQEDKKDLINLEIVSAGTPELTLNILDNIIGGNTNQTSNIIINGNQNGDYKIILGNDGECNNGLVLVDWTTGYIAGTDINYSLNALNLQDGSNSIFVCLKNDENKIGSVNGNVIKDIINPNIFAVSANPGNVVSQNSNISFTCGENGKFQIVKGGTGVINTGELVGTGNVLFNNPNTFNLDNSFLDLDDNDIHVFCLDEAENYSSQKIIINKTLAPPSFEGAITNFIDNDIDYDGLDGRDIFIEWDNSIGINYKYFESYRIYVLPSNIILDTNNHDYLYLNINNNNSSFLGDKSLIKDSLGNNFVSGSLYKACISIMGTNGLLGTPGCSSAVALKSDIVTHPIISSAKFTSDTNLEITTNATLDNDINNHSGSLISYTYKGSIYNGKSVSSINGQKINIEINALGDISAIGTNLLLSTGALRADGGGFNDNISFSNITDGQIPTITGLVNNTISNYNNFFSGSINLSYTFGENMKNGVTKFEITRIGGNLDSTTHLVEINGANLLKGTNNQNIDLSTINLVNGTNYQFKIVGQDLAGNFSSSNIISNIKYDKLGPDIVIQNITNLYSTLTPNLSWLVPLDNFGNGSGVKKYYLNVYNGLNCSGIINQTHIVNINSKVLNTLGNIADYSWKVVAIDNMENIGIESICSNFRVDTSVPIFSDSQIKDTTISSTSYFKESNNIEISSKITDTDINHIWLDLSQITGNVSNNNELCSNPSVGIICTYTSGIVKYSFIAGASIIDGVKQVQFNAQNTSGGNDTQKIVSITADSTNPVILSNALLTPNGIIGGISTTVTWNTSKILDNIGLNYIKAEYSTGAGLWNLVGTGVNNGSIAWDLTSVVSGNDYKIKLTAFDLAGNSFSSIFPNFEIDRIAPLLNNNTIIFPNGGENLGGNGVENIIWNSGSVIDSNISNNPISLYYSTDGGVNWNLIASNLLNNGIYSWNHSNINFNSVLIKLEAKDTVGNISNDLSNNSFIIDTTKPVLSYDFTYTPVNGNYINNSGFDVVGNTSDIYLLKSSYIFQNLTTGEYYNGTSFNGNTEILNNICIDPILNGTNNLCNLISFNLKAPILDGNNYRLILVSEDEAGNITKSIPVDYIGDTTIPTISINTLSGTYFSDSINISGTSGDLGSGISSVKIQIKKGTEYWNGTNFVSGIQTLNTQTSDNYTNWNYNFNYFGLDDSFEITVIAYDKSFKINNVGVGNINIIKDSVAPNIIGGKLLFSSPSSGDIYIGGENIDIIWDAGNISDTGAGLLINPIKLEYFDGLSWNLISDNELNDGNFLWKSAFLDTNNAIIRLTATDLVGNYDSQNSDSFIIDSTPPSISSVETMDLDANGEIDALNIIMSENIKDSSIVLSDFYISNGIGIPSSYETGNSFNDNTFILKFQNTGNTSIRPTISYTKGNLTDIAGKYLENTYNFLSIDKASPRLLSSEIYDINENGKFDKIISTFSENLSSTSDIGVFDISNLLDGISISSVSIIGNQAHILLSEGNDFDTDVGTMKLSFNSNLNWKDLNNNQAGSIINGSIVDKAKPVAYIAEYYDENGNSKVDKVYISFSENLIGFQNNDLNISGLIKNTSVVLNNIIIVDITETIDDNDTGVIAKFSLINGNLKDINDNFVSQINNSNILDKVAPKLLSLETNDANGNGKIDSILLLYSEDINSNFNNFLADVDGYNVNSYIKKSPKLISINVDEKFYFDSDSKPLVKINSNTSISDINGNLVKTFIFTQAEDKVGPVIIGARYDESLNKIFIQSSENINNLDFLANNFILNNAGAYTITSTNSIEKSITLTGESVIYGSTEISFVENSIGDSLGNKQSGTYFTKLSPPIIINEIMISDNSSNNYVELRNLSNSVVDISNFEIAGVTIPVGTNILASGYYLISKDTMTNSIINVVPDLVDNSLNISGNTIVLNNGIIDIDFANLTTGYSDLITPKSIERKNNSPDGKLSFSWYTAQISNGFDDLVPFGTPGSQNVFDAIAPTIGLYNPIDDSLFPNGNFKIDINYSDNIGGLGIDILSDNISLKKWDGINWGVDLSSSYIDLSSKIVTSTKALYQVNNLEYGKYKIDFSILDKAGNITNKTIIFYVDELTFTLNSNTSSLGNLESGINNFSENETIITIETIGAGFNILMKKDGNFTNNGIDIIDFNGLNGFGFELYDSGYLGNLTSMGTQYEIVNESKNINLNGNKNIFVYKLKYGAKIDIIQGAGYYSVSPRFEIKPVY